MITEHEFDFLSDYCKRCGKAASYVLDHKYPCITADNLIPISHIIAQRRMFDLVIRTPTENINPDSE